MGRKFRQGVRVEIRAKQREFRIVRIRGIEEPRAWVGLHGVARPLPGGRAGLLTNDRVNLAVRSLAVVLTIATGQQA